MPTRLYLRIAEILLAVASLAIVFAAWRANLRDQAQLAADLAVAKQALAQDAIRQHERDARLAQTLAALAAEKRAITTPAQILRELPKHIPLPVPITLPVVPCKPIQSDAEAAKSTPGTTNQSASTSPPAPCSSGPPFGPEGLDATNSARPNPASKPAEASAVIPTADLKPLYDFAIDCKACQAKLATAQADLTDERAKTATLARARDEAVRIAKGGSLLRRVTRNAKWLLIGAAAGAIAAKAHP